MVWGPFFWGIGPGMYYLILRFLEDFPNPFGSSGWKLIF